MIKRNQLASFAVIQRPNSRQSITKKNPGSYLKHWQGRASIDFIPRGMLQITFPLHRKREPLKRQYIEMYSRQYIYNQLLTMCLWSCSVRFIKFKQNSQKKSFTQSLYSGGNGEKYQVSISYFPSSIVAMFFTFVNSSCSRKLAASSSSWPYKKKRYQNIASLLH